MSRQISSVTGSQTWESATEKDSDTEEKMKTWKTTHSRYKRARVGGRTQLFAAQTLKE